MTAATSAEPSFPSFSDESMQVPEQPMPRTERLSFTGSGSEYFRIWIVNLLLTILTLGIYSAWAKVRRMRYFYDNTHLAGSTFEYHGKPLAILKGRLIAVAMLGGYNILAKFSLPAAIVLLLAFIAIGPWLAWKSLQFKLFNSSYRGIRFGFRGQLKEAYRVFFWLPIASAFTGYILAPYAHQQVKLFQHSESRYGSTYFSFHAGPGKFYAAYGILLLASMCGMLIAGVIGVAVGVLIGAAAGAKAGIGVGIALAVFSFYLLVFLLIPVFNTLVQKAVWNNTKLDTHQFQCDMEWRRMTFIAVTNILGIIVTLGLYAPFAKIRSLRYRIESISMVSTTDLDNFVADNLANISATGEGVADVLDFDLSL